MNLKNVLELADKAIANNNHVYAKSLIEKELELNPNIFELNFKLGLLHHILGDLKKALNFYEKTTLLNPNFSPAYCNLGIVYDKLDKRTLAIKYYQNAIEKDPKNFKAYFNLGNCYLNNDDLINAEKYYYLSISIQHNNIHPYINLFQIYDRSNNLKKLDEVLKKAQNIFKNNSIISFFEGISEYRKNNYQKTINIFEKLNLDPRDISKNITKFNTLAKCYDHLGMFENAFKSFTITNTLIRDTYEKKVDKKNYIKTIEERFNFFSQKNFKNISNRIVEDQNIDPTFLVGFPRSGTTLLDTILRTHSSIEVLEEKPIVDKLIKELHLHLNKDFMKLDKIDVNIKQTLRSLYFETRNNFVSNEKNKLYIDKLPLNIIYIGELSQIFPNSKFILALRNPFDSVMSCFMQPFTPNDAMANFYNLSDATKLYDEVFKLWMQYEKKLKIKFHKIKYEEIVEDFDLSISSLLKFLDLEWDNKLKEFYKTAENRGIINTPSYNQINKPIYNKSIGRWKNYKNHFEGLEPILKKWSSNFNY